MPLVRRTRAILRRAEFGFFGVIVRTWRQTPRFCGAPGIDSWRCRRLFQFLRMAGALTFRIFRLRPLRTSWLMVGTEDAVSFLSGLLEVARRGPWRARREGHVFDSAGHRRSSGRPTWPSTAIDVGRVPRPCRRGRATVQATKAECIRTLSRVSTNVGRG